jgi:hypothetical protein
MDEVVDVVVRRTAVQDDGLPQALVHVMCAK